MDSPPLSQTNMSIRHITSLISSITIISLVLVNTLGSPQRMQQHTQQSPLALRPAPPSKNGVRVLSFGSSSTYGVGLNNPWKDSYPYRLGADNAASANQGLAIAAACTQTLVQDSIYDLVTIEFTKFDQSVDLLTERIRQRFPNTKIVLIRIWRPSEIQYENPEGKVIHLDEYMKDKNLPLSKELYLTMLETDISKWSLPDPSDMSDVLFCMRKHQAYLYTLPRIPKDLFGFPQSLDSLVTMFGDNNELSEKGHEIIARSIRSMVPNDLPENRIVGNWGQGDHCAVWYENGNVAEASRNLRGLKEFGYTDKSHKHAIEVEGNGNEIQVHNPFVENRIMHLSYMTASEDGIENIYPKTRVRINGKEIMTVDPYHEYGTQDHLVRSTAIGVIPPGDSKIRLIPVEPSTLPFRVVGASILNDQAHKISLDLSMDSVSANAQPAGWKLW